MKFLLRLTQCAAIFLSWASLLSGSAAFGGNSELGAYLDLPSEDAPYLFISSEMDLRDALKLFGRNLNVAVRIDEKIEGRIGGTKKVRKTRKRFLDDLASEFGFFWHFDGLVLHFTDIGSISTAILPLRNNDGQTIIDVLKQIDIYQKKFTHRTDPRSQTFLVSGPSDYVALVEKAVEAIEEGDRKRLSVIRGINQTAPELPPSSSFPLLSPDTAQTESLSPDGEE